MKRIRALVPPNALVAFEAAARHQSFTRAANELHVTQGAVSRQVAQLEDRLGVLLFERAKRRVRLTPQGKRLHAAVVIGLGHIIETAASIARPRESAQVTLATTIAFSSFWLMPRLHRFYECHPNVELHLLSNDEEPPASESLDVLVWYGGRDRPGWASIQLFDEAVRPVCSPHHPAVGRVENVESLLDECLLHLDATDSSWIGWAAWLRAMGVTVRGQPPGPHFNNYGNLVQAAVAGQGIALGWRRMIEDLLATGALVELNVPGLPVAGGYQVGLSSTRAPIAAARLLRDWLLEEACKSSR